MYVSERTSKRAYESVLIRTSDAVKIIDPDIVLPEHEKKEIDELRKKIEENGIEVPILVRANGPNGYKVIDVRHRRQISRELSGDCPATLHKHIDDARAREIALEENLSRRPMTHEKKRKIVLQLRDKLKFNDTKIAERLCVHRITIGRWIGFVKLANEKTMKQKIINFYKKRCEIVTKIRESIKDAMADFEQTRIALCEEEGRGVNNLQEEVRRYSHCPIC